MPITRRRFIRTGLLGLTGVVFLDAFWVEKFFIETKEFYLGSATKESLNIKVVQISDLHLHSISYQLISLTNKINLLQPDLIVFTGDVIDKAKNVSLLKDFLKLIDKDIKKIAILGNWEYLAKVDLIELAKAYTDNNCELLINRSIQYSFHNKTISITGIDDYLCGDADFDTAVKNYKLSDYNIVLTHCPQYSDHISTKINKDINIDFILSGHTHGGQINLFGLVPYLPKGCGQYLKGWYNSTNYKHYVSKGIGTAFLPIRFGARAEIAIFNLST